MNTINVYVDGACTDNGKNNAKAGYGVYFSENDPRNENGIVIGKQSNNTGELTAFIRALEILEQYINNNDYTIHVYIDSDYVIKCASSYGEKLERNDWKTSNNKIPPNLELVKKARNLFKNHFNIKLHHIKAHTNKEDVHSMGNAGADRLACMAIGVDPDEQSSNNTKKEEITVLDWISFNNKDEAKQYGAKWDNNKKLWYITNNITDENKEKIFELKEKNNSNVKKQTDNEKKYYIKIAYSDKNKAKSLGARWDSSIKSWFYTDVITEDKKKELLQLQKGV